MPGNTIADTAIIPDMNIYTINSILKLSDLSEKLLLLLDAGLKYVIVQTIIIPNTKNIIFLLLVVSVFISDFIINGIDAIINPRNKEFI